MKELYTAGLGPKVDPKDLSKCYQIVVKKIPMHYVKQKLTYRTKNWIKNTPFKSHTNPKVYWEPSQTFKTTLSASFQPRTFSSSLFIQKAASQWQRKASKLEIELKSLFLGLIPTKRCIENTGKHSRRSFKNNQGPSVVYYLHKKFHFRNWALNTCYKIVVKNPLCTS